MNTIKKVVVVLTVLMSINTYSSNEPKPKPKPKKSKVIIGYHTVNHKKVNEFRKWSFVTIIDGKVSRNKKCYITK